MGVAEAALLHSTGFMRGLCWKPIKALDRTRAPRCIALFLQYYDCDVQHVKFAFAKTYQLMMVNTSLRSTAETKGCVGKEDQQPNKQVLTWPESRFRRTTAAGHKIIVCFTPIVGGA